MTDLEQMEKKVAEIWKRNASVKFGDPRYRCSIGSDELLGLLVAFNAVLPVVKAAEAWRAEMRSRDAQWWTGRDCELMDAVDQMRSKLGGER